MQNQNNGRCTGGCADSFFRSTPQNNGSTNPGRSTASTNWNTEAASQTGQLGSKDLSIIQDEMYSEALLYKKCSVYSDYFTDPQLKRMASNAAEHHRKHFDTLHGYLNASN